MVQKESRLRTRNVSTRNRRTSVRLEPELWEAFERIARKRGKSIHQICGRLDDARGETGLTSAIRVFIVTELVAEAAQGTPIPAAAE